MDPSVVVQSILNLPLDTLDHVARETIPDRLPFDYLASLAGQDKIDILRACLIIYFLTSTTIVPRVFQLQASIAILNGRNTIISAGTGSGKTLCLLIPMLLRPKSISITISPLKRLQTTQVRCQLKRCHPAHVRVAAMASHRYRSVKNTVSVRLRSMRTHRMISHSGR